MPTSIRVLLAVSASTVLVCVAFGCLLALNLELDGIGRERDTPVRAWYALSLATGALLCVAGAGATALLLPKGRRSWLALPVLAATVVVTATLGLRVGS